MKSMILYGHPESGHSYKVKLMMDVAKIDYEYRVIDINLPRDERPEPFRGLSLSRFGEVPLLTHGQDTYVQSNAILLFLAEHTGRFGGKTSQTIQKTREWLFWEHNKIGLCLPHLRLARNFFPSEYPTGAVEWLLGRYQADVGRLEKELSDGRDFVIGEQLTIADFSLCGYFYWANQAQVDVPPHVERWLGRISALDGWQLPYALLSPEQPYTSYGLNPAELDFSSASPRETV
jgi:glutathione S-transferase